jgi:hypothetical protein
MSEPIIWVKDKNDPRSYEHPWLLYLFILALISFKLYLVTAQNLFVFNSIVDDRLFIELAKSIGEGHWLGAYDSRTLIKGPMYPLWIALISKSGLPLLISQQLLYITACLFFLNAVGPMVKKRLYLLITFCFLLFNPMSYSSGIMDMVDRQGIYPALALFVVSITLKALMENGSSVIRRFFWSITLGIFLSAFWLTREESIWILPFFAGVFTFVTFHILRNRQSISIIREAALWLTPFFVLFFAIVSFSVVNKVYYDIFSCVEIKAQPFREAYGALLRVRQKPFKLAVPVPKETRREIYAVSDAFLELKPFIEGQMGRKYIPPLYSLKERYEKGQLSEQLSRHIQRLLEQDKSGIWRRIWQQSSSHNWDILGISFIWVFRDAVAAAGHYEDWAAARNFYTRLAAQINRACEDGRLECLSQRSTLMPPWRNEYIMPFLKTFFYLFYSSAAFSGFDPYPKQSCSDPDALALFREVTGENEVSAVSSNTVNRNFRLWLLEKTGWVYQIFFPFLAGVMVILYFLSTFRNVKNRCFCPYWFIATSLGMCLSALILGLSYIHITSFSIIETRYLAPAYPLIFIFCIFSWFTWRSYPWTFKNGGPSRRCVKRKK